LDLLNELTSAANVLAMAWNRNRFGAGVSHRG
jgi:hypothetical protein